MICKGCAICCVVFEEIDTSWEEIARISDKFSAPPSKFFDLEKQVIRKEKGEACPFLNEENTCSIYKQRPETCKLFDCKQDNKNVFAIAKALHGDRNEKYTC